jgi:hypothetical protein
MFYAAPAISTEDATLPLFGIQYIEDRAHEYPSWDVPQGYDMEMMFGTYQVDVVRECSERIAMLLGRWAGQHSTGLLKEVNEHDRLVLHAKLPEYEGIIAFVYRIFREPPRARFTAEFVDRKGLKQFTGEVSSELSNRYQLTELAMKVRQEMRCLK